MRVEVFFLGPLETNSYLAMEGREAVVVDAGGDPAQMIEHINRHGLKLKAVLITHLHCDHIYGVKALQRAYGVPAMASDKDEFLMDTELGRGGLMGLPLVDDFPRQPQEPGEMELLGQPCQVLATPGHSLGSLSYYFPQAGMVFVGDLIFYRNIGRTDFPGGGFEELIRSAKDKILGLPPETVIYSGHGPDTSVGQERMHNPYFSDFATQS